MQISLVKLLFYWVTVYRFLKAFCGVASRMLPTHPPLLLLVVVVFAGMTLESSLQPFTLETDALPLDYQGVRCVWMRSLRRLLKPDHVV